MSDKIDWHAVGLWAAFLGLQATKAAYEHWKGVEDDRKARYDKRKGYERIQDGETVNGWRIASFVQCEEFRHFIRDSLAVLVPPSWPIDDEVGPDPASINALSVLLQSDFGYPLNPYLRVCMISRHSLAINRVMVPVVRIVYPDCWDVGYQYEMSCSITDRIVVTVFRQKFGTPANWSTIYHLILVDEKRKDYGIVTIEPPTQNAYFTKIQAVCDNDIANGRLNVIFVDTMIAEEETRVHLAAYKIPVGEQVIPLKPTMWRSISVREFLQPSIQSYTHPLVTWAPDIHEENGWLFSTDGKNIMRAERPIDHMRAMEATVYGSKVAEAIKAYHALLELNDDYSESPMHDFFHVTGFESGGSVFGKIQNQLVSRLIYPPTLTRLAAKALCRAFPDLDWHELQSILDFDLFDGMLDNDANESPVIYLPWHFNQPY